MAFCHVFVNPASTASMRRIPPPFSSFFFLSFGFIIIELNRTWKRKIVTERDIERDSLAKKGGEAKKKRKRRKDEKAVGACNDTWLCVSRKREKRKPHS